MKNQKLLFLGSALLLSTLVGCGGGSTTLTTEKAEEKIATFDKALSGTVKATYHADYVLDVESESASARAFAEDVDKTIEIEADFTAGDLYLHAVTGTGEDKVEALVYENGDSYYYLENTLGDPIALENEEAALAKIGELVKKVSKTKAGWVNLETFLYSGNNAYEHKQFLLDSTNVPLIDLDDTRTFAENDKGGLDITSSFQYVGYTTDGGVSELSADPGANFAISTDSKGHVLSFTETYNDAKLEMPIMTPAPILTLSGTNTFTATYDAEITKLTTIEHAATFGKVTLPAESTKGYVEVFTCAPYEFTNMKPVNNETEIPVGNWLCIKVTVAEGNTVEAVTYAGNSQTLVPPQQAGGYYCFTVIPGTNAIGVNISGSAELAKVATVVARVEEGHTATITGPVGFTLANGAPSEWDYNAEDGFAVGDDKWAAIQVAVEEGLEAVVTVNGKEAFFLAGFYCVNTKAPATYEFVVSTKAVEEEQVAVVTVTKDANVATVALSHFDVANPTEQTPVTDATPVGRWLAVSITCAEGYEVNTVQVGGQDLMFISGFYCYNVKTTDAIEVVITTKAAA